MMPIISAVELKTVEITQGNKIIKQSERIFYKKISDLIKKGTLQKHSILFIIVYIQTLFRLLRAVNLDDISWSNDDISPKIIHPLIYLYSLWIYVTLIIECEFWGKVSNSLGWNWPPLLK
jgi:hypothetical protein